MSTKDFPLFKRIIYFDTFLKNSDSITFSFSLIAHHAQRFIIGMIMTTIEIKGITTKIGENKEKIYIFF